MSQAPGCRKGLALLVLPSGALARCHSFRTPMSFRDPQLQCDCHQLSERTLGSAVVQIRGESSRPVGTRAGIHLEASAGRLPICRSRASDDPERTLSRLAAIASSHSPARQCLVAVVSCWGRAGWSDNGGASQRWASAHLLSPTQMVPFSASCCAFRRRPAKGSFDRPPAPGVRLFLIRGASQRRGPCVRAAWTPLHSAHVGA
jgi:hypothetical protein